MIYRPLSLVGHGYFHSIFLDNVKKYFKNSGYIREHLPGRIELFELPMLKSGDLNLKAYAFKFLIVLLLWYNILFYFNLYSSLAVTSHKKRKDSLEGNLDRVLLAAELEFPKILVPRLPQHTWNVNIECAGKSEWSKQQYSLYVTSFLEHWYILILLFWY